MATLSVFGVRRERGLTAGDQTPTTYFRAAYMLTYEEWFNECGERSEAEQSWGLHLASTLLTFVAKYGV